jgi:hypothetical protein
VTVFHSYTAKGVEHSVPQLSEAPVDPHLARGVSYVRELDRNTAVANGKAVTAGDIARDRQLTLLHFKRLIICPRDDEVAWALEMEIVAVVVRVVWVASRNAAAAVAGPILGLNLSCCKNAGLGNLVISSGANIFETALVDVLVVDNIQAKAKFRPAFAGAGVKPGSEATVESSVHCLNGAR